MWDLWCGALENKADWTELWGLERDRFNTFTCEPGGNVLLSWRVCGQSQKCNTNNCSCSPKKHRSQGVSYRVPACDYIFTWRCHFLCLRIGVVQREGLRRSPQCSGGRWRGKCVDAPRGSPKIHGVRAAGAGAHADGWRPPEQPRPAQNQRRWWGSSRSLPDRWPRCRNERVTPVRTHRIRCVSSSASRRNFAASQQTDLCF